PPPRRAGPRPRRASGSSSRRCVSWWVGCFVRRSRRTTYTGGPRSYSCRRTSWSDDLGGADRPLVPVLVGPTGVGKTAVAVAWGELEAILAISADARQVYRRLDIGTAKPDQAQRARVPHLGIDLVDPGERYSAGQFARDASVWLAGVWAARQPPAVVGGTGVYVRALDEGLFHETSRAA